MHTYSDLDCETQRDQKEMAELQQQRITTICVFCGSSLGKSPKYAQHAEQLASEFLKHQITLVYGGGSIGIMGKLASAIDSQGGKVLGIIPHALHKVSGGIIGECLMVDTMHDRKATMSAKSDAFIALPGGFGTMEELVEAITWSQLRIHAKPIGILNTNGYFDMFIKWMDQAVDEGFIDIKSRDLVVVASEPHELMTKLFEFHDPIDGEWILNNDMWKKRSLHLEDV